MKKYILLLCSIILMLTGCEKKELTKKVECNINTETEKIKFEGTYELTYTGNYIDNVKFTETYTVEEESLIQTVEDTFDSLYKEANDIKYFNYTKKTNNLSVTSIVDIDYSKINLDEYVKFNENIKSAIKDNKIEATILINSYKSNGATCKDIS